MNLSRKIGLKTIKLVEYIVLGLIALATVVAIGEEIYSIIMTGHVDLADLLLLFIYLEVLAMVSNFVESGQLPIRMPLYIAIVALARYLILDMKSMGDWRVIAISISALIMASTVIVIRLGHIKLAYPKNEPHEE